MSSRDRLDHLRDILESSAAIQTYLAGVTLAGYQADRKTKRAVERELQILTEAAYRLGDEAAVLCPEVDWRGVRGLGNFLRHEYNKVDDKIVWDVVHTTLPVLHHAVAQAVSHLIDLSQGDR